MNMVVVVMGNVQVPKVTVVEGLLELNGGQLAYSKDTGLSVATGATFAGSVTMTGSLGLSSNTLTKNPLSLKATQVGLADALPKLWSAAPALVSDALKDVTFPSLELSTVAGAGSLLVCQLGCQSPSLVT